MHKPLTLALAVAMTATACAMAAASAWGRAATQHAQLLLAIVSVAVVAAVHMLPALLRTHSRFVVWPVWSLCLAAALWGHAGFFASSNLAAAEAQRAQGAETRALEVRRQAVGQALDGIKARPVATVAAQLARITDPGRRAALEIELTEAKRAAGLRDELVRLAATSAATAGAAADPVTSSLSRVTGIGVDALSLAVALLLALLLEVLGMLLWMEALGCRKDDKVDSTPVQKATPQPVQQIVQVSVHQPASSATHPAHEDVPGLVQTDLRQAATLLPGTLSGDLARLRVAIERGECRPTLAGIRTFMRCGQGRAVELRATLLAE